MATGCRWAVSTRRPLPDGLRRLIGERIDAFEGVWSRFRPDSLVSRAAAGALPPDDDGAVVLDLPDGSGRLLDLYDALHRATGGRLDPLVGADLVELGYDPRYSFVVRDGAARPPREILPLHAPGISAAPAAEDLPGLEPLEPGPTIAEVR